MLALWALNERLGRWPLLARCAAGALVITGVELAFGVVCNLALGWRVWDYSLLWGNLWGQICPLYSSLWFLLCIPIFGSLSLCRARLDAPAAPGGGQGGVRACLPASPRRAAPGRRSGPSPAACRPLKVEKAAALRGGGQGRGHPASKLPGPQRRPNKEAASFHPSASPGPSPPHAASRTLFRTKKSVRSDAHYVGRTGLRLGSARRRAGTRPPRIETTRTPAPPGQRGGQLSSKRFARSIPTARGVPDTFQDKEKCPFRCALRGEDRPPPRLGAAADRDPHASKMPVSLRRPGNGNSPPS